jgi:hypothetical protein
MFPGTVETARDREDLFRLAMKASLSKTTGSLAVAARWCEDASASNALSKEMSCGDKMSNEKKRLDDLRRFSLGIPTEGRKVHALFF